MLDMIRSVFAQTFTDWELVLLDDGSTDNSLQIAKSINDSRVKVFTNERNLGIPASLNRLTILSNGKYIARMDSDDISAINRIQRQLEFMEANPNIDVLGCGLIYLGQKDIPLGHRFAPVTHEQICKSPTRSYEMAHPTIMAKKTWFQKYKYNESISRSSDYELFLRTHNLSKYTNIPQPLFYYRLVTHFNIKKLANHRHCNAKFIFDYHMQRKCLCMGMIDSLLPYLKLAIDISTYSLMGKEKLLSRRYEHIDEIKKESYIQELEYIKNIKLPLKS